MNHCIFRSKYGSYLLKMAVGRPLLRILLCHFIFIMGAVPSLAGSVMWQCPLPIDPKYHIYDDCARLCLGCQDTDRSFGHVCEPTSTCCLEQGHGVYLEVWSCVKQNCTNGATPQSQWELYLQTCSSYGLAVNPDWTPTALGFTYVAGGKSSVGVD